MNIALLAPNLPPANDGVGDHAERLAQTLGERGHDVVVFTAGRGALPSRGYRREVVGTHWGMSTAIRAAGALRAFQPAALIVEYAPSRYGANSPVPLALLVSARWLGIRSAAIVHEAQAGSALTLADAVAVPNDARADALRRRLPSLRSRVHVVPVGANVEAPPAYRRDPARPARIVAFGVVSPQRRLERVISAVARLAQGRDVYLDIIGRIGDRSYADELQERARALGIGERVVVHGELAPAALSAAFGAATVAIHTARDGALASSGSLLAVLAHSLPVVAVRTPFDDDVFAGAVHYADDNDLAVATALRALVDEPRAAASLIATGVARWRSHFSWETVADRLLTALQPGVSHVRVFET